jgi:hypothetical protein
MAGSMGTISKECDSVRDRISMVIAAANKE